ncbi:MAG TPA: flagellar hook-basal body complex protein FliE [Rhizomicrobium sp.]|jgi:flagellar hook-basal body complex protein FliE|nr:flagellar hook-basal body complex protein FliE [Rhizomicrobium sp.]
MPIAPAAAAAAYQAVSGAGASGASSAATSSASATGGQSFSDFLSGAVKDAVSTMHNGEAMAAKQVAGQADIVSVVNAVNSAELTLNTVVAVRDKVVQAYQSIMQMPI